MVVGAAETEFVPVAVYNNVEGQDAVVLRKFREPAWNNPVLRFLHADETDIIPRKEGEYTTAFVLPRMVAALERAKRPVPAYLKLALAEAVPGKPEVATFAMFCYWEGEAKLGAIDGVISTRIGELHGSEVVEVLFDADKVDYKTLVVNAREMKCATKVFARNESQLKTAKAVVEDNAVLSNHAVDARTQQQYHLAYYPNYHYLPLTASQATKVNAALASKKPPDEFLSPWQIELYKRLTKLSAEQGKLVQALKPDRTAEGIVDYALKLERTMEAR